MAKLTRYSSFEELKSAPLDNPLTPAESTKAHAEFEKFMKLLQQEFAAQKKQLPSTPETMPTEEELASASEGLHADYKLDEELTAFTQLDAEAFRKTWRRAGDTINPELDGKYDNEPFFQEKVNRANEILKTAGVPKFPERSE